MTFSNKKKIPWVNCSIHATAGLLQLPLLQLNTRLVGSLLQAKSTRPFTEKNSKRHISLSILVPSLQVRWTENSRLHSCYFWQHQSAALRPQLYPQESLRRLKCANADASMVTEDRKCENTKLGVRFMTAGGSGQQQTLIASVKPPWLVLPEELVVSVGTCRTFLCARRPTCPTAAIAAHPCNAAVNDSVLSLYKLHDLHSPQVKVHFSKGQWKLIQEAAF